MGIIFLLKSLRMSDIVCNFALQWKIHCSLKRVVYL